MRTVFKSMAVVLCCAVAQAAGIDAVKSLGLGSFEITQIAAAPAESAAKPAGNAPSPAPVLCVEISAKKDSGSRVKMNIALPPAEKWNKIYLAKGNGGLGNKTSAEPARQEARLGYAASHNNLGTEDWQNSPDLKAVIADFGHRAIYQTALVSQKVIAAYYGQPPRYSYYSGGSTGGQEGLSLAQRHPELFDGIVVLYPVTNRTRLHTRFAYERKVLAAKQFFTPEEIEQISAAIVAQNRGNAGEDAAAAYPFLKYPERAKCDYARLTFLTTEQLDVLRRIHDVVRDARGQCVTVGFVPSAELADRGKSLLKGYTGDWIYPMALGAAYSVADVNFDCDLRQVEDLFAEDCNVLPDLDKFRKLGRKLIIIQGKLDTIVPAQYAREYYDAVAARNGGREPTRSFARIFFVPGMWHGNQSNCNPLAYLRQWVEEGVAPQRIDIAVRYQGQTYPQQVDVY